MQLLSWVKRKSAKICKLDRLCSCPKDHSRLRRGYTWISFTFWAMQKLSAHPTIVCIKVFYKDFGDFWVYLGGVSFSQRIGKIRRNKKFGRFNVVWKLEFEVKISRRTPRQSPTNLRCSCVGVNCLAAFQNQFSFFYPLFKLLKISFNFIFTTTIISISVFKRCIIYLLPDS